MCDRSFQEQVAVHVTGGGPGPSQRTMRTKLSPLTIGIGLLAALGGWALRGLQFGAIEAAPVPVAVPHPASIASKPAQSLRVEHPSAAPPTKDSRRNLFSYVEPPPAPVRTVAPPAPPTVEPPVAVLSAPIVEARRRLQFAHRYIGNFGTRERPIAAFSHEGTIVTARAGDRIDAHFVLRAIGVESVEVEAMVDGERQSERIALR